MTTVEKLEREKKWRWKYGPIIISGIIFLIFNLLLYLEGSYHGDRKDIIIILIVNGSILIYYIFIRYVAKLTISLYDIVIQNERLKLEIKERFHLSTEEYVEIFLKDDASNLTETFDKKNEAKFYAKLISEDEIEIIVKDEKGETIEKPQRVTRFSYLTEVYKTKP